MSDTDDWRRARRSSRGRRGGDDGFPAEGGGWSPPPTAEPFPGARRTSAPGASDPEAGAVVTRFDAGRGFGFVTIDGDGGDAFLHVSVLQRAGVDAVAPGTRLRVRVGQGQKGPQVTEVLEVGGTTGVPPPPRAARTPRPGPSDDRGAGAGEEVRGTVKWYNAEKGFGFVAPEGGGRDVFVHASALERSGTAPLVEGQPVVLRVVQGRKGPEAETVRGA